MRRPLPRNVGAVCLGTVMLGYGCSDGGNRQRAGDTPDPAPPPPDLAPTARVATPHTILPRPRFQPPVGAQSAGHDEPPHLSPENAAPKKAAPETIRLTKPTVARTSDTLGSALPASPDPAKTTIEATPLLAAAPNRPIPVVAQDYAPLPLPVFRPITTVKPTVPKRATAPASTVALARVDLADTPVPVQQPRPEPAIPPDRADIAQDVPAALDLPPEPVRRRMIERQADTQSVEDTRDAVPAVAEPVAELPPATAPSANGAPTRLAANAPVTRQSTPVIAQQTPPSIVPPVTRMPRTATDAPPPAGVTSAALVPQTRVATSLGLERADNAVDIATGRVTTAAPATGTATAADTAALVNGQPASFTVSAQPPVLSYQDELILEAQVEGFDATDTVLAFGTRGGVYLPLGTMARILDLAITVSDDGNYASGWVLDPDRNLALNLRAGTLEIAGEDRNLARDTAVAFDGEMYVRADRFVRFMPLEITTNLRNQTIRLKTLQPFPFQERLRREAQRMALANRTGAGTRVEFPRRETPYLLASVPAADIELRALAEDTVGPRGELDLRLAGDFAFLTAQAFISADTIDGLTASLIEAGRRDPDAQLLGPLQATAYALGDVSTTSMPLGLRSAAGRGFSVTNTPVQTVSVFERIDLRGVLREGYEVELYRNDILVGSTRQAINGQYEFEQIPVDFGLNVFRLVFYGPQGQRSEEVRQISVGDGRLAPGKLVYRVGAVQKDENVLGVREDSFVPRDDFGTLRASGEVAYGVSSGVTAVASAGVFETDGETGWIATGGIRTGLGRFAVKADLAVESGDAYAASVGLGGKLGASAFTISHVEYVGSFFDETRVSSLNRLRRATELDFNTRFDLASLSIPLSLRARRTQSVDDTELIEASARASVRTGSLLLSNTLDFSRTARADLATQTRLFGNFDLATLSRAKLRGRVSVGYRMLPDVALTTAAAEVDYALDERTALRAAIGYAFDTKATRANLSAVRDFDRFTLAATGGYGFQDQSYTVGVTLGFSLGRDPLRDRPFITRTGLAGSGGASLRAFRDRDGDGIYGGDDTLLPDVNFTAFNQVATTDERGVARLSGLGEGRGVNVQVDSGSLPDIDLAPLVPGIEIVPRPGRIHSADFAIVALSEIEGTVRFASEGRTRGVSGVRLQLRDADDAPVGYTRTELDGYYFFERVKPGRYSVVVDPDQATKLDLCPADTPPVDVGFEADLLKADIDIVACSAA
ncbi:MAG: hypothetical protein WA954_04815 [Parerythrobacter sp.]